MILRKYPRTRHLQGSRLQPGDEDLDAVPVAALRGRHVVIEEKLDGANAALSFDDSGALHLQSRGHYLTGGPREKHFALFKTWANAHQRAFAERLSSRYVMYGEWLYAKHTIFYDALPHYFLEFDVLDRGTNTFLSTERRRELLNGLPVTSVPVLSMGSVSHVQELHDAIRPALFQTPAALARLSTHAAELGVPVERTLAETDPTPLSEGLYLKVEEDGVVSERYKFVRATFLTQVLDSGSHWLARPIVPNLLRPDVDFYAGAS
jgi:hypothetical protein